MNTEKLRGLERDMRIRADMAGEKHQEQCGYEIDWSFYGKAEAYEFCANRLAAIIAEEEAREPVAWRPIETCPNEQDVLIAYDDGSVVFTSADENDYEWGPYRQNAKGRISGIARAQHWMPLPQPPSAATKETSK